MKDASKFEAKIAEFDKALKGAKRVLITAPGTADGDSLGSQLALRRMFMERHPHAEVWILNDEEIPPRYRFLPDINHVHTPETYSQISQNLEFDLGIIVDGGLDRAGRIEKIFRSCPITCLIDHHIVSFDYDYTISIVEPKASATTELIYHMSQTKYFNSKIDKDISQQLYLGLIFDTGFFRHSCTTPESMELGAQLIRTGFDFTRVGERGMLERNYDSLKLLAYTISKAELRASGQIIWSSLSQDNLNAFHAAGDDKEGIIDHLFLTHGVEVAVLFFELPKGGTKVSFRSLGKVDVAHFAQELTVHGGGHEKAAGAHLETQLEDSIEDVLVKLEAKLAA